MQFTLAYFKYLLHSVGFGVVKLVNTFQICLFLLSIRGSSYLGAALSGQLLLYGESKERISWL